MADTYISSETDKTTVGIAKKTYNDEEVRAIEIHNIYNYSPDDGLRAWENIFRSLRDGITKEGMLQLISLACHIQNREGEPLMKGKSSNHRTRTITNGTHLIRSPTRFAAQFQESARVNQDEEDGQLKFKAICYFAACLMRLVCKPPDNLMRGLAKIKNQYSTLYFTFSPFLNSLRFERSMAEHISLAFRLFPEFRCTLAHHVASAEAEHSGNRESLGILRFACIQHLEFNGMTAYSQFVNLIQHLKILSPAQYLTWLRCPENNTALNMICHILCNHVRPTQEGRTPSLFWKYARIFDSGYFLELQPVSCKYLMAIQAYLTIRYVPANYENHSPLNIAVIKNDKAVLSSAKLMADEFVRAYDMLETHLDMDSSIFRLVKGITKEMADDYARRFNILSVHLEEAGPLWRSINKSKTEGGNISDPRIQEVGGPSNSITATTPPDVGINQTAPMEGENSHRGS